VFGELGDEAVLYPEDGVVVQVLVAGHEHVRVQRPLTGGGDL
jgi:hypothetical protein